VLRLPSSARWQTARNLLLSVLTNLVKGMEFPEPPKRLMTPTAFYRGRVAVQKAHRKGGLFCVCTPPTICAFSSDISEDAA
jgi:hypothetical protein